MIDVLCGWQVKVTVLEDNDPMDEYRYLLSVSTGHRRGASTSAQVNVSSDMWDFEELVPCHKHTWTLTFGKSTVPTVSQVGGQMPIIC